MIVANLFTNFFKIFFTNNLFCNFIVFTFDAMITLKPEVIKEIQDSGTLRSIIQVALGVSHTTLYKYLRENDPKLANVNVLEALKANTLFKTDKQLLLT